MHPNAYLKHVRNVRGGLRARSKILLALEDKPSDAVRVARDVSLSYGVVMYHLRLLKNDGIVQRKGGRPYCWVPSGLGQKQLS